MKGPLRPFFVASVERQSSLKEQRRNIAVQIFVKKQIAISRTLPVVKPKLEQMPSFFDRAARLAEALYTVPPEKRLGFMQQLIGEARAGNTKLREVLTNQKLLRPNPIEEKHLFYRSESTFCTIAQAAQYYCKRYWKANVADVAYNRVEEPETGEVISIRAVSNDNKDKTNP